MTPRRNVITGGVALALALTAPLVSRWEGKSNDPYKDIVGVQTVCYGETRVPMKRYTNDECKVMLHTALGEFQKEVLLLSPELKDKPYQLAAATSLAYNIGTKAYSKSSVRRNFKAGKFKQACEGFKSWVYAGKKKVQGLVNRRNDEYRMCISGL